MPESPALATRRHDIDALRVGAFALLILYHAGMYYVADWDWHVKSAHLSEWLQLPMLTVNRWRMDLIFLISGVAVHFLLRNSSPGEFLASRTARLLVPLAFGMAVVVPVQPYAEALARGAIEPGFVDFLVRYWFRLGFPPDAFTGAGYGWTWNHLWYLPYLWAYTVVLVALRPLFESTAGRRLRDRLVGLRGAALLLLPAVPLLIAHVTLRDRFPTTHALWDDWFNHSIYFTAFLYGWLLGTNVGIWRELARLRRTSLVAAATCFAFYCSAIFGWLDDDAPWWQELPVVAARWVYTWLAIATLLGWAHAYLNRPFRWLPYATQAVYPWYILHQSVIIALAWFALRPLGLGPVAEPVLLLLGTFATCFVLHHFVIRRVRWLQPLFGVKPAFAAGRAVHRYGSATIRR